MAEEFNLSEKIWQPKAYGDRVVIDVEWVVKFIKKLKEDLDTDFSNGNIGMSQYHRRREAIDKRAGGRLI